MTLFVLRRAVYFLIAACGLYGLAESSGVFRGGYRKGFFAYYTNLSNLFIVLLHAALFIFSFKEGRFYQVLSDASVMLAATLCITVTFLIFFLLLRRNSEGEKYDPVRQGGTLRSNRFVHYYIPAAVMLEWFFLADKNGLGIADAFYWLAAPCAYFLFAMLRARTGRPIPSTHSLYPYPFMDIKRIGGARFFRNIAVICAGFFLLACVFLLAARVLNLLLL